MSGSYITKPQEGKQYEIGFKQDLFDSRAMLTAALFRIDKKNMPMSAQPDGQCDPLAAPALRHARHHRRQRRLPHQPVRAGALAGPGAGTVRADHRLVGRLALVRLPPRPNTSTPRIRSRRAAASPTCRRTTWRCGTSFASTRIPFTAPRTWPSGCAPGARATTPGATRPWAPTTTRTRAPTTTPATGIVDVGVFYANTLANGMDLLLQLNIENLFNKTYYDRNRFANGTTIVWQRALRHAQRPAVVLTINRAPRAVPLTVRAAES